MALSAAIQWEVRPTNGGANNGGGFTAGAAGTDYSQQDAAQKSGTDLAIHASDNTQIQPVAAGVAAADVGNVVCISAGTGFTAGLYEITAQDGTYWTVDRATGTTGSTVGTYAMGGARTGYSTGTTTLQSSLVAGQKVWIKNEAWNEAVVLSVAGAAGAPIVHEGYNTTRGDVPTGASRPRNNRASAAGDAITLSGANQMLKYVWASNAGSQGITSGGSSNHTIVGCRSSNNGGQGFRSVSASEVAYIGCEADTNASFGFYAGSNQPLVGCYSHDNTGTGLSVDVVANVSAMFTIIETNAAHGITATTRLAKLINVTIDGNTGASTDGINLTTPTTGGHAVMLNCICSNNGRDGVRATDGDSVYADYNNYYGNAGTARTNFPAGAHDQAVDPQFTDRANGDFSIGANLKALGWPGLFPAGLSTGYLDIGAVQRQEPAGGGGLLVHPGMSGGMRG